MNERAPKFRFGFALYCCTSVFFVLGLLQQNKIRVLETELSRAAAERDLLRKVAVSAEARQHSEGDRAKELAGKSEVRMCTTHYRQSMYF